MIKSKLIKNFSLIIMLCTIIINIIVFYLYHSPAGLLYTSISGLILTIILYTSYLFASKESRIILFGILLAIFLYALYLFFNQVIIKNFQVSLLLTATINLILITSSIGLIQKASSKYEVINLRLSFLILFIIGFYNLFTLIAQKKTSSDYNISFVIFLLSGSFLFLLKELISPYFNSDNLNNNKVKNHRKTLEISLENREAIQREVESLFRESDVFTAPDFSFDDFVDAISFTKKE